MKSLRTAYFDCYSGISGDMILGALIDLGVQAKDISKALKKIDLTISSGCPKIVIKSIKISY